MFDIRLNESDETRITQKMKELLELGYGDDIVIEPLPEPNEIPAGLWAKETTNEQKAAFFAKYPDGYERTGALGESESFTAEVKSFGTGEILTISSDKEYAQYVVGVGTQVSFHRNRWWTMRELAEKNLPLIIEHLRDMVRLILD